MANIHEIKQAYDDLQVRYANTLSMLLDALDKLDEKPTEIEVEKIVEVESTLDVDLSTPREILALEKKLQGRADENSRANSASNR
jgi:hypothetical protein